MSTSATIGWPFGTESFFRLALAPRTGSSSRKAVFEDEVALMNLVSSSEKAVYEDEMGLAEGSAMGTPIIMPEMKYLWGSFYRPAYSLAGSLLRALA